MSYKIQNIEPFNDTYYRSCFFNSFFPVIKHFGKAILPYFMYDIMVYVLCDEKEVLMKSEIVFLEEVNLHRILKLQGIDMYTTVVYNNIIPFLYENLYCDKPVILWIDAFYTSYRKDVYHKSHWPHSILVYGCDKETERFYVIDHCRKEDLLYGKKELSASELFESYNAYLSRYLLAENALESCYVFEEIGESCMENVEEYKEIYRVNLIKHRRIMQRSLDALQLFANSISYNFLINNADYLKRFTDGISNIILNKEFELYRFKQFFPYLNHWSELQKKITSRWSVIRAKLLKVIFSNKKPCDLADIVACQMKSIIQEEYICYKMLMKNL